MCERLTRANCEQDGVKDDEQERDRIEVTLGCRICLELIKRDQTRTGGPPVRGTNQARTGKRGWHENQSEVPRAKVVSRERNMMNYTTDVPETGTRDDFHGLQTQGNQVNELLASMQQQQAALNELVAGGHDSEKKFKKEIYDNLAKIEKLRQTVRIDGNPSTEVRSRCRSTL